MIIAIATLGSWVPVVSQYTQTGVETASSAQVIGVELFDKEGEALITRVESSFRVMTYNIQHGADAWGRVNLPGIASVIKWARPDVVFLTEVDHGWRRSGFEHQADRLAQLTSASDTLYSPALSSRSPAIAALGRTAYYGNAFLTQTPILDQGVYTLPRHGKSEPRNATYIEVIMHGERVRIYGVHLSTNRAERADQLKALSNWIASSPAPTILLGDFNASLEELKVTAPFLQGNTYREVHQLAGTGSGLTFPAPMPTARIDHIFVSDELLKLVNHAAALPTPASDHLPVIADFLPPPNT